MASFEIWIDDPYGIRLKEISRFLSVDATKIANSAGAFSLTIPAEYDPYLRKDSIIEIWRKPDGGAMKLFNAYFIRRFEYEELDEENVTTISGVDGHSLLSRRIVAYNAGSTQAEMTTYADDMAKAVVRDNMTTDATDSDRDWTGMGVSVATNLSDAPSITLGFSRKLLTDVLKDIVESSRRNGTRLYYDFVPVPQSDGSMGWQFRTYTDQPGADRTGDAQVVFGRRFGNLRGAAYIDDYINEVTVVYAGGQGREDARAVEEVEDTTRSGSSPWGRIERFYNASSQSSSDGIVAAGEARLGELRPTRRIAGTMIDTEQARFQLDWFFGDRVVIDVRGQHDAVITMTRIMLNGDGKETIKTAFEVVE